MSKIEEKCKFLEKKMDQYQMFNKGIISNRLKKKSMSALRWGIKIDEMISSFSF